MQRDEQDGRVAIGTGETQEPEVSAGLRTYHLERLARGGENARREDGTAFLEAYERNFGPIGVIGADDDFLYRLSKLLASWSDAEAAQVLRVLKQALDDETREPKYLREHALGWIERHGPDNPERVTHCIQVVPPEGIDVIKVLTDTGAQKRVFLARWSAVSEQPVVLKTYDLSNPENGGEDFKDAFANPLRVQHPNIIETHFVPPERDTSRTAFLIERRLRTPLRDNWDFGGCDELVNLLRDVASALRFVHNQGYVHADVKLDNMGFEARRYLLMDFGLCRRVEEFGKFGSPSGTLRTRAPELVLENRRNNRASEIWALAACVLRGIAGTYPLLDRGEEERLEDPDQRKVIASRLPARAREVGARVDQRLRDSRVPPELDRLLREMLRYEPGADDQGRPKANEVVLRCEEELSAYVRPADAPGRFAPQEVVDQLERLMSEQSMLELSSRAELAALREKLLALRETDADDSLRARVTTLERQLPPVIT